MRDVYIEGMNSVFDLYVVRLHAGQFGNNCMDEKNSEDFQIGQGRGPSHIWQSNEFFKPIFSKLDKHVILLTFNYIASVLLKIFA